MQLHGEALVLTKGIREIFSEELGKVFSATVLDLYLKKYIEFETVNDKEKIVIKRTTQNDTSKLKGDEIIIYNFLNNAFSAKETLTLKELKNYIKANPERIIKLKEELDRKIPEQLSKEKLYTKGQKEKKDKFLMSKFLYVCLIIGTIFYNLLFFLEDPKLYTILVSTITILAIINFVLISKIYKKINVFTQKGLDEIEQWNGLTKYMKDYSRLRERETLDVVLWEKYLVFATVFGISKKVIKQLEMAYPEIRDSDFLASYAYMNMMVNTDFADTFTSAVHTSISSTYSSATGGGGGFSGGGGGGRWPAEEVEADSLQLFFENLLIKKSILYIIQKEKRMEETNEE